MIIVSCWLLWLRQKNHPNQYEIRDWKEAGLDRKSYVNFGVVQDFDSGEIGEYVGKLSDFDIQRIKSQRWDESLMKNINQNNNKESEIKESMAEKSKKEYLEEYLGVDVTESGYDDNVFETDDGEEYLVVDEEEADEFVKEEIGNSLWAFNADFILRHMKGYDDITTEDEEAVVKAIELVQEKLSESANPLIAAIIEDFDEFVSDAVDADGRGHFLAFYDGEEIELADDRGYIQFYAYQRN